MMEIKYIILIYIIIISLLFYFKPKLFKINKYNRKRKMIYLISLTIIISIICFYLKVYMDWFFY